MSSRVSRPRSRRRLVGVSAVAVGALLSTYAGALRNFTYARAITAAAASCSPGATLVADDTELQAAITNSVDDSVICITADITVSGTLSIDDTTLTLEGREIGGRNPKLSGDYARRILDVAFTDNASDDTLAIRDLALVQGRASGQGGALLIEGGNRLDALVLSGTEIANNYSTEDGGGVSARNLATVYIDSANFHNDTVGDPTAGDIAGGALKIANTAQTTIKDSYFRDNSSVEWGGAVFLNDSGITRISGSTFERNASGTNAGGAIEVDIDDSTLPGALYITSSVFRDNSSNSGPGGAVRIDDNDDTVSISSVIFDGNSTGSSSGGGLNISSQSGLVFLTGITATDNTAGGSGGFLRVSSLTSTLTIDGLNSRRNYASSDGGSIKQTSGILDLSGSVFMDDSAGSDGGAIYFNDDTALIAKSTFTGNHAGTDGGAIHARATTYLAIREGVFIQNIADDDAGGVYIRSDDSTVASAIVRLEDSKFTSNTSVDDGGGVYLHQLNAAYLTGLTVQGNEASDDGGGLTTYKLRSLSIQSSTFRGNSAADDGGGAWLGQSALKLTTSTFADNTAGDYSGGAGIYDVTSGLTIYDTTFSGNSAVSGAGGIYAEFAGQADITNSTFVGNSHSDPSQPGGGGLWLDGAAGQATLDFLTVVGNTTVSQGGGLFLSDLDALVTNSIVTGNTAGGIGADVYLGYSFDGSGVLATLDDSYSLFTSSGSVDRDPAAGAFTFSPGPGTIFGAPKLNGLADNGGPTLTMLPQWDSPAFQAGDPNWTAPPANDQRGAGFTRDAGGRVSMGAIQGRSAKPIPPAVPASPPREVQATAGDREVLVSWTPPATTGTFPITAYQVDDSTGNNSCLLNVAPGDPLSCVIEDLTNGTAYSFRVRALTGAGWGAWSDFTADVTPEPGPSIMITGTREGKFAAVAGVATGLVGETLIPRLRFPGPHPYKDGEARPVVDDAGDFTWQRQTRKKVYVYFFTEDRELRSNRVIIRPRG